MSDLRKSAETALEALEKLRFANAPFLDEAMEALRQALAQPDEVLAEREACAKVCEVFNDGFSLTAKELAEAIRARSKYD